MVFFAILSDSVFSFNLGMVNSKEHERNQKVIEYKFAWRKQTKDQRVCQEFPAELPHLDFAIRTLLASLKKVKEFSLK